MAYKDKSRKLDYERRRTAVGRVYIQQVKMSIGECQFCGLRCDTKRLHDFHFDHIDPKTKRLPISRMQNHAISEIQKEMDKCQLLCRDCHMKRTVEEGHYLHRQNRYTAPANTDQLSFDL